MEKVKSYISRSIVIAGIIIIITHLFFQLDDFFAPAYIDSESKEVEELHYNDTVDENKLWKNTEFME